MEDRLLAPVPAREAPFRVPVLGRPSEADWPGAREGPGLRAGEWRAADPRPRGSRGGCSAPAPLPARAAIRVPVEHPPRAGATERTAPLRRFWFSCESQMAFAASGSYI